MLDPSECQPPEETTSLNRIETIDQSKSVPKKCPCHFIASLSLFLSIHNSKFAEIPHSLAIYTHLLILTERTSRCLIVFDSLPCHRKGSRKVRTLPQSHRAYAQPSKATLDKHSPFYFSSGLHGEDQEGFINAILRDNARLYMMPSLPCGRRAQPENSRPPFESIYKHKRRAPSQCWMPSLPSARAYQLEPLFIHGIERMLYRMPSLPCGRTQIGTSDPQY
jgi:hypothetical protein